MDNHPTEENQYRIEYPSFGRSQAYHREIQGTCKGRSCFSRSEQRQLQQDTQRDRQTMRLQGAADLSCSPSHERHARASVTRRTHRNREPPIGAHEHQDQQIYAKITAQKISQDMETLSHKLEEMEKNICRAI